MSPRDELSSDELLELLEALGGRLEQRGETATLYLVGGAAMAIGFDQERRTTADIDAIIDPTGPVVREAELLAVERNLRPDWLNSNAAAYVPGGRDADWSRFEAGGLTVVVASPKVLAAMKLNAFRRQDQDDLVVLFGELGITEEEQAVELAHEMYGADISEGVQITETDDGLRHYARVVFDLMRRAERPGVDD